MGRRIPLETPMPALGIQLIQRSSVLILQYTAHDRALSLHTWNEYAGGDHETRNPRQCRACSTEILVSLCVFPNDTAHGMYSPNVDLKNDETTRLPEEIVLSWGLSEGRPKKYFV